MEAKLGFKSDFMIKANTTVIAFNKDLRQFHSSSSFEYLRVYLNFFYFVGFSPYRYKYNRDTRVYYVQQFSRRRKVIIQISRKN